MNFDQLRNRINAVRGDIETRYPIRLIGVFGSAAREDTTAPSDIDILVESKPGLSLFKLGAVRLTLEEAVGLPVDLVFESVLKPRALSRVQAELRIL